MRLFVTGTDTGVGKTRVTALLAATATGRVLACKPVASGVPPGEAGEDAEALGRAAGHPPLGFATFAAPLSPHRAARLAGRALPPDLLDRVRALDADTVLVEGVGGWRVPLGDGLAVVDLARATGPDVLVVAADRLGVLNHALLTLDAVRADGLRPVAVALSRTTRDADASTAWNAEDLAALAGVPVVPVPHDPAPAVGRALWRVILQASVTAARPPR